MCSTIHNIEKKIHCFILHTILMFRVVVKIEKSFIFSSIAKYFNFFLFCNVWVLAYTLSCYEQVMGFNNYSQDCDVCSLVQISKTWSSNCTTPRRTSSSLFLPFSVQNITKWCCRQRLLDPPGVHLRKINPRPGQPLSLRRMFCSRSSWSLTHLCGHKRNRAAPCVFQLLF